MSVDHWILIGSLVTLILSGAASVALYARVITALREHHRSVWEDLGAPTLFSNNSLSNASTFWRFNFKREYKRLEDPRIARLFWWMNAASIIYGLGIAFIIFVFVVAAIRG